MPNPDDKFEGPVVHQQQQFNLPARSILLAVVLVALVAVSGYSLLRLSTEEQHRTQLERTNQALEASLEQAKSQLKSATEELNAASARVQSAQLQAPAVQSGPAAANAQEQPAPVATVHRTRTASASHRSAAARSNAARERNDARWSAIDAKMAEQQKQIDSNKSDLEKTRQDMEGRIGSTRDELNGAIAKTHDEVVELRKRGERNYYEFTLNKSSQYERTGPVSLSLRKSNEKHKYYDLALIVDDQKIEKKHVNLYEPLWISVPDRPEPVQVVVNNIGKNSVKGYLSESKYRRSELSSTQSAKAVQPASSPSSTPPDADSSAGPLKPR